MGKCERVASAVARIPGQAGEIGMGGVYGVVEFDLRIDPFELFIEGNGEEAVPIEVHGGAASAVSEAEGFGDPTGVEFLEIPGA